MHEQKCLEDLPDEILLEIFSYLNPYSILHSFGHLNGRLKRIVSEFCSNLDLSFVSYNECQYLFWSSSLSFLSTYLTKLTMSNGFTPGQIGLFQEIIGDECLKEKLPLLKSITMVDFENENINILTQLLYLEELNISFATYQKLELSTEALFQHYIFASENNFQKATLNFDKGLHLMQQAEPHRRLKELIIELVTINDLIILFTIVPNVERLCFNIINDASPSLLSQIDFSLDMIPKSLRILFVHTDHKQAIPFQSFFAPLVCNIPSIEYLSFGFKSDDPDYADAKIWATLIKLMPLSPTFVFGLELQITMGLFNLFNVFTYDDLKQAVFDSFVNHLPSASLSIYLNQETLYIDTVPYRFDHDTGYRTSPEAMHALHTNSILAKQSPKHIIRLELFGEHVPIKLQDYLNVVRTFPGIKFLQINSMNVSNELADNTRAEHPAPLKLEHMSSLAYMRSTKCQVNRTFFDYVFFGHQRLTTLTMMYSDLVNLLRNTSSPINASHIKSLTLMSQGADGTVRLHHLDLIIGAFAHIEHFTIGLTSSKLIKKRETDIVETLILSFKQLRAFRLFCHRGTFQIARTLMNDRTKQSEWLTCMHASGSLLIIQPKYLSLWKCESQITYF